MKKKINSLSIFQNYLNEKNLNLKIQNLRKNEVGNTKYFPPFSREWKNTIYGFNANNLKNIPIYSLNINSLLKNYFDLYLKKFLIKKTKNVKIKRFDVPSFNKIFISKPYIRFTNNKVIITLFTYNKEKLALLRKIAVLKKSFFKNILKVFLKSSLIFKNLNSSLYKKTILKVLHRELSLYRRLKLKLNINKFKYEEIFLYKLNQLINNLYERKVKFNIINLKSIMFNSDIFTQILISSLKDRNSNIIMTLNKLLSKVKLPEVNKILERTSKIKSVDVNLIENKLKNLYLNSILNNNYDNLDEKLNELSFDTNLNKKVIDTQDKISQIIFDNIKYKNMGGVRLEIKGRITKRFKAERAGFKVRWKGGLKNIDSSFQGLSSVCVRGHFKPNVDYSILISQRRMGAFAIKGWVSGK